MKKRIIPMLLAGALTASFLISCNREGGELDSQTDQSLASLEASAGDLLCMYIDKNWSKQARLVTSLKTEEDTNFLKNELQKNATLWGLPAPSLSFVNDTKNPGSTDNAASYSTGKIYYGYALYYDAKEQGSGNIVNAMIMAHEYGHQLQYKYPIPSVKESTDRAGDLEADGFAGYYLRKPTGFNKTDFAEIATAYEYAAGLGDEFVTSPNHHGTGPQRRAAVRLGFLLGQFNFTATEFDSNFFHYYSSVLGGTDATVTPSNESAASFKFNPEVDKLIKAHTPELKKIASGEISATEFKNLN